MSNPVEHFQVPERQPALPESGALNLLELQERISPQQARGTAPEQPAANFDRGNNQLIRDGLLPALQLAGMGDELAQYFPPANPGQGSQPENPNQYYPPNPGQGYPPENQGSSPYNVNQQMNQQEGAAVTAVLGAVMNGLLGGDQSPPSQDPSAQPDAPAPAPALPGLNPLESQSLFGWGPAPTTDDSGDGQ
jgi:hypothetical protein